jgi:hypothetical protein
LPFNCLPEERQQEEDIKEDIEEEDIKAVFEARIRTFQNHRQLMVTATTVENQDIWQETVRFLQPALAIPWNAFTAEK